MPDSIHPAILQAIKKVTAKRPRTVIDHIVKHGFITTEELANKYGYNHPPRAARDVREAGIPLETFKVTSSQGRSLAAYRFADPKNIESHKLGGRKIFSKQFAGLLYASSHERCVTCSSTYEQRFLQIDHRVPYEVSGDNISDEANPSAFMLLCGSCQRKKSWTCEHCSNWTGPKESRACKTCFWGHPEEYDHIAMKPIKRLELVWQGDNVRTFEELASTARQAQVTPSELIHQWIRQTLARKSKN